MQRPVNAIPAHQISPISMLQNRSGVAMVRPPPGVMPPRITPRIGSLAGLPLNMIQRARPAHQQTPLSGPPMIIRQPSPQNDPQPRPVFLRQGQPLVMRQPQAQVNHRNPLIQQSPGLIKNENPVLVNRHPLNVNIQGQSNVLRQSINAHSQGQGRGAPFVRNLTGNPMQISRPSLLLQNSPQSSVVSHYGRGSNAVNNIMLNKSQSSTVVTSCQQFSNITIPSSQPSLSQSHHINSTQTPNIIVQRNGVTPRIPTIPILMNRSPRLKLQGLRTEQRNVVHVVRDKPYARIVKPNHAPYSTSTATVYNSGSKKDSKDLLIEGLQKELLRLQKENSALKIENKRLKHNKDGKVDVTHQHQEDESVNADENDPNLLLLSNNEESRVVYAVDETGVAHPIEEDMTYLLTEDHSHIEEPEIVVQEPTELSPDILTNETLCTENLTEETTELTSVSHACDNNLTVLDNSQSLHHVNEPSQSSESVLASTESDGQIHQPVINDPDMTVDMKDLPEAYVNEME